MIKSSFIDNIPLNCLLKLEESDCRDPESDEEKFDNLTKWICFGNEIGSFIYGIRISDTNGDVELRKLNVVTKTNKRAMFFPNKVKNRGKVIGSICGSNKENNRIGFMLIIKSFEREAAACAFEMDSSFILKYSLVFFLLNLETGQLNRYEIHENDRPVFVLHAVCERPFPNIVYLENFGWVFRKGFKFFSIEIDENTQHAKLVLFTEANLSGQLIVLDNTLVLFYNTHRNRVLESMQVFNFKTKEWNQKELTVNAVILKPEADWTFAVKLDRNLIAFSYENSFILELDRNDLAWHSTLSVHTPLNSQYPVCLNVLIMNTMILATFSLTPSNLVRKTKQKNCVIGICFDVRPLQDLCLSQVAVTHRRLFQALSDQSIRDVLKLPKTVMRKYLGPEWTCNE